MAIKIAITIIGRAAILSTNTTTPKISNEIKNNKANIFYPSKFIYMNYYAKVLT
jgi:hypothetical protein